MEIKEVIVVEGYHDAMRLKQFFNVETIVTNGSALSSDTIALLKQVSLNKEIIIFCDPDYPGEQIRKKIISFIPNAKHAYISKEKAIDYQKHKVGVEHASYEDLKEALENVVTFKKQSSLTWEEYLCFDLAYSKSLRATLCLKLKIGICNSKTLFKRLNMLGISFNDLDNLLNGEDNE
ncbi:MAG: ribonuclease M5 [Bacilli bacterium]